MILDIIQMIFMNIELVSKNFEVKKKYIFLTDLIHKMGIESRQWRKIDTIGTSPECIHHSAVVYQGSMYLFGGTTDNNLYEYRFGMNL